MRYVLFVTIIKKHIPITILGIVAHKRRLKTIIWVIDCFKPFLFYLLDSNELRTCFSFDNNSLKIKTVHFVERFKSFHSIIRVQLFLISTHELTPKLF